MTNEKNYSEIVDEHNIIPIEEKTVKIRGTKGKVVKGDSYSNIYTFRITRKVEGIDLAGKKIIFLYRHISEDEVKIDYACNVKNNDDNITFSWVIPPEYAKKAGNVAVTISFVGENENGKPYALNMSTFLDQVEDSNDGSTLADEPEEINWFARMEARMASVENYEFLNDVLNEKLDTYIKNKKVLLQSEFNSFFADALKKDTTVLKKTEFDEFANNFVKKSQIVARTSTLKALINHKPTADALDEYFEALRSDKVYITKLPKFQINQSSTGIKEGDNAGLVHEPSTDTVKGRDDYADLPEFKWFHANYVREDNGNAIVVATEYDPEFKIAGAVDVGSVGMSFYYRWDTESDEEYIIVTYSTAPHPELGLIPFSGNVEGHSYWCLSAYASSIGEDGLLRSLPNGIIANFQSCSNMITNYQKKGKGYYGCGIERNTLQLIMLAIKDATKNSQNVYAGMTAKSWQYTPSVKRDTLDTFFTVTKSQADSISVGDVVCCGYGDLNNGAFTTDRYYANLRAYADRVRVLKKEVIDENNVAIYLDVQNGFPLADIELTDTIKTACYLSVMANVTGEVDKVLGKHDGSCGSNSDGRHAYRIQGVEYGVGYYIIPTDTVMVFKSDYSKDVYVAPKGVKRTTTESTIKSQYKKIGNIPANTNGSDYWIGDVDIDEETGGWYPSVKGSGDKVGTGDMLYAGGASTSGTREYLQGGCLWSGSCAGASFLYCRCDLSGAWWYFCGCD